MSTPENEKSLSQPLQHPIQEDDSSIHQTSPEDEATPIQASVPPQHPSETLAHPQSSATSERQTPQQSLTQETPAPLLEECDDTHQCSTSIQSAQPSSTVDEMIATDHTTPEPIDQSNAHAEKTTQAPQIEQPITEPVSVPIATTPPLMEIEDLLALKIVSDPQISPDGRLIAFVIQQCNAMDNTTSSAIWLVETTPKKIVAPRQISSGAKHDTSPRWSPDGQTLAFLSDREGSTQLYLLPITGGEARGLSSLEQGITEYSWHPHGQLLLAHSAWKPQDDQQQQDALWQEAPIIYTRLGARWNGKGDTSGRHQQLWLIPLDGNPMRLTSEPVDLVQSCWSPDGHEIVFSANRRSDPDLTVSMALWVLTLATGQLRRLTPVEGLALVPSWSPDGKCIAYLYTPDQTEAGNIQPWVVDVSGNSSPRLAVSGADSLTCQAWIIDELRDDYLIAPVWYPNSQALLVPAQQHGQIHLYHLDLTQQTLQRLTSGNGCYLHPQISHNGQTIAFVRADWFTPGDIWSMASTSKQTRKLTRVNDALLQSHQLIRPKRINWQSFDNQQIEGWLYLPPEVNHQKVPLILMPHGGPSLAWGDSYVHEFQVLAGHGYAVLAPNPRGSAGYGDAFCRSVLNDWGGNDFKDLMAGVDHVITTESVDAERLGISGLSYGGFMTNWAITQTPRFKAAVSRNGISSLSTATLLSDQTIWFELVMNEATKQQQRSPLYSADAVQTPLLLLHAEDDLRCPFSESYQFFVALRKRKQPVELVKYHQASHLMDWPTVGTPLQRVDRLRRTFQWLQRFV